MTSINSYSFGMPPPPRMSMDNKIGAAVEAGSLSEVDGDALEAALNSIDTALSSSAASDGSSRLDPSGMKDRVDSLIDDQVAAGTLTQDQAAALQSFFAQGPGGATATATDGSDTGQDDMSIAGMGEVGGAGPMRGPPPGPPPAASDDEDDDSSTTTSTDATSTDATSAADQLDSIIAFLENLRSSLSQSLYGSASTSTDSTNSGLVIDSLA